MSTPMTFVELRKVLLTRDLIAIKQAVTEFDVTKVRPSYGYNIFDFLLKELSTYYIPKQVEFKHNYSSSFSCSDFNKQGKEDKARIISPDLPAFDADELMSLLDNVCARGCTPSALSLAYAVKFQNPDICKYVLQKTQEKQVDIDSYATLCSVADIDYSGFYSRSTRDSAQKAEYLVPNNMNWQQEHFDGKFNQLQTSYFYLRGDVYYWLQKILDNNSAISANIKHLEILVNNHHDIRILDLVLKQVKPKSSLILHAILNGKSKEFIEKLCARYNNPGEIKNIKQAAHKVHLLRSVYKVGAASIAIGVIALAGCGIAAVVFVPGVNFIVLSLAAAAATAVIGGVVTRKVCNYLDSQTRINIETIDSATPRGRCRS